MRYQFLIKVLIFNEIFCLVFIIFFIICLVYLFLSTCYIFSLFFILSNFIYFLSTFYIFYFILFLFFSIFFYFYHFDYFFIICLFFILPILFCLFYLYFCKFFYLSLYFLSTFFENSDINFNVEIVGAELEKSGIFPMRTYCRIISGQNIYESKTDHNSSKKPIWNKLVQLVLPRHIDSFSLEIFDQKSIKSDVKIAWAEVQLPTGVYAGKMVDRWVELTGKNGYKGKARINIFSIIGRKHFLFVYF